MTRRDIPRFANLRDGLDRKRSGLPAWWVAVGPFAGAAIWGALLWWLV